MFKSFKFNKFVVDFGWFSGTEPCIVEFIMLKHFMEWEMVIFHVKIGKFVIGLSTSDML